MITQSQYDMGKELVEALRSGKYIQGKGRLKSTSKGSFLMVQKEVETFCCLGVACDLAYPHNWGVANDYLVGYEFRVLGQMSRTSLVYAIQSLYGLDENGSMDWMGIMDDESTPNLVNFNDDGFTFSQIADILDYYYDNTPIQETFDL